MGIGSDIDARVGSEIVRGSNYREGVTRVSRVAGGEQKVCSFCGDVVMFCSCMLDESRPPIPEEPEAVESD